MSKVSLTDEDIIKALKCCSRLDGCCGYECPFLNIDIDDMRLCSVTLRKKAIKLINRPKAEIERLKHILVSFMSEVENWEHKYNIDTSNIPKIAVLGTEKGNAVKQIKSEAIKEFAEMLKEKYSQADILCPRRIVSLTNKNLDNLVKEMTDIKG